MEERYSTCSSKGNCQILASRGCPTTALCRQIRLSLRKSAHSSFGRKSNRNSHTFGLRTSRKCPPPISKGLPSTSAERQSPPASFSFSSIRKDSSPFLFNIFAKVRPAGPAPKIRYFTFSICIPPAHAFSA